MLAACTAETGTPDQVDPAGPVNTETATDADGEEVDRPVSVPARGAGREPGARSAPTSDAARGAALLGTPGVVDHVADGDTLTLRSGAKVRLVQIDTPETFGAAECGGAFASATLKRLLPRGTRVRVERDPALDQVDHYGRVLAYVRLHGVNLNLRLVQAGAASVWFYGGDRGRYASQLLTAARAARAARRGIWGSCPGTRLDVTSSVTTGGVGGAEGAAAGASQLRHAPAGAGPNDSTVGLPAAPAYPPDVNCSDLPGPVRVTPDDPHQIDGDGDGVGCDR